MACLWVPVAPSKLPSLCLSSQQWPHPFPPSFTFSPSSEFLWTHCLPESKLLIHQESQLPSAHPHPLHPSVPIPVLGPQPAWHWLGLPFPDLGSHPSPLPGMPHLHLEENPQFQVPPFLLQPAPLTSQGAQLSPTGSQHTRHPRLRAHLLLFLLQL